MTSVAPSRSTWRRALPTLLIWGEQDEFQPIEFAERYATEIPAAQLVRISGARHIPTADGPDLVAASLISFLGGSPTRWPESV